VGRFDFRCWWIVLPLIPFTTPHNRGLRISAFCGGPRKAEFEHNVISKRTLAGLKAARARGRVGGRPRTWRAASGSASARCTNRWVLRPRRN